MLDIIGAMTLTSIAFLVVGALIVGAARNGAATARLAWGAAIWFAAIVALAAAGAFSTRGIGTPVIGAAVLVPVVAGLIALGLSRRARAFAFGIPLPILVGVHAGRLLGVFFVALHAAGRLPPTFALSAGWGDIWIATLALPLAFAIHGRVRGWRPMTWAWNSIGIADLVMAVTLGIGSAPDSPVRFIHETPAAGTMGALPWTLTPAFLVPIYLLAHVAIFARLATGAPRLKGVTLRGTA